MPIPRKVYEDGGVHQSVRGRAVAAGCQNYRDRIYRADVAILLQEDNEPDGPCFSEPGWIGTDMMTDE